MHSYLIEYEGKIIGCYVSFFEAESFILSCLQNNLMKDSAKVHVLRKNSCFKIKTKKISLESYAKKTFNKTCRLDDLDLSFNECTTYSNSNSKSDTKSSTNSSLLYESSSTIYSSTNSIEKSNFDKDNKKSPNEQITIDYSNPVVLEMAKQKIDLQHKINMLRKQKEKIEESKNVYDNDIKLFNMFKKSKESNCNFEIPELFAQKYEIMKKLEESNSLTWENFIKNYQQENDYVDYFASNSYEDMFISNSDSTNNCVDVIDVIEEEFNINTDSD